MVKIDEKLQQEAEKFTIIISSQGGKCIPIIYSETFVSIGDGIHDAQGDAFTVPIGDESNVLRIENFKATNGPGLVCLSLN